MLKTIKYKELAIIGIRIVEGRFKLLVMSNTGTIVEVVFICKLENSMKVYRDVNKVVWFHDISGFGPIIINYTDLADITNGGVSWIPIALKEILHSHTTMYKVFNTEDGRHIRMLMRRGADVIGFVYTDSSDYEVAYYRLNQYTDDLIISMDDASSMLVSTDNRIPEYVHSEISTMSVTNNTELDYELDFQFNVTSIVNIGSDDDVSTTISNNVDTNKQALCANAHK